MGSFYDSSDSVYLHILQQRQRGKPVSGTSKRRDIESCKIICWDNPVWREDHHTEWILFLRWILSISNYVADHSTVVLDQFVQPIEEGFPSTQETGGNNIKSHLCQLGWTGRWNEGLKWLHCGGNFIFWWQSHFKEEGRKREAIAHPASELQQQDFAEHCKRWSTSRPSFCPQPCIFLAI